MNYTIKAMYINIIGRTDIVIEQSLGGEIITIRGVLPTPLFSDAYYISWPFKFIVDTKEIKHDGHAPMGRIGTVSTITL